MEDYEMRIPGVIVAQQSPPPVDHERAKKETALDQETGFNIFGEKNFQNLNQRERYLNFFPGNARPFLP